MTWAQSEAQSDVVRLLLQIRIVTLNHNWLLASIRTKAKIPPMRIRLGNFGKTKSAKSQSHRSGSCVLVWRSLTGANIGSNPRPFHVGRSPRTVSTHIVTVESLTMVSRECACCDAAD
jgi:hypothetical protein